VDATMSMPAAATRKTLRVYAAIPQRHTEPNRTLIVEIRKAVIVFTGIVFVRIGVPKIIEIQSHTNPSFRLFLVLEK
jgi:hypothetical protein